MKGNDEITGLFRSRLSGAEMTVRDGFWEELKGDLSRVETDATNTSAATKRSVLTPRFYRVAAAASVVLVLGAASAAFWYFSPKDEIQEAFTKVATLTPEGNLNGDVVQEKFPSIHETKPTAQNPGHKNPVPVSSGGILAANGDDEETVSVTVSITISQRVYGNHHQGNGMYGQTASSRNENNHRATATDPAVTNTELGSDSDKALPITNAGGSAKKWAFKAGIGTACLLYTSDAADD